MILAMVIVALLLGLIPVCNTFANCWLLRRPSARRDDPSVAILIPARNEEGTIVACIDAALASRGAQIEVIVLDDGSTDRTAEIVAERALQDHRLRLESAPPLPPGWKGKPHACQVLASLSRSEFQQLVEADVQHAPETAATLAASEADLVSGVPRQLLGSLAESAVVPMINSLIYGYLPIIFMRAMPSDQALAAACGQLLIERASAYRACGGFAVVVSSMLVGLLFVCF